MFTQGEILEVAFPLPQANLRHPVIVISNNEIHQYESFFIGVMGTTKHMDDEFAYLLEDHMLTAPMPQPTEVRCHLLSIFTKRDVIGSFKVRVKPQYLKEIIQKIHDETFKI
jgi:mRNA-degrading endonuclease toxin of MazEF toxin-antitoxin module